MKTDSSKYFFQRHPHAVFSSFIAALILIPCFIEFIIWIFLQHPSLNLKFPYLQTTVADIYYNHELDIVQYMPQCAQYDSQLLYVMKEGVCHHHSIEFDCDYSFNRLGLRDDEASLHQPEFIVLGDSYAMGWGMGNDKIFSSLIERETGLKTMNASVPSYGTAREFLLLDRLDLGNLKYLVIQHCLNDFKENEEFVENGYSLKSHPPEFYKATVERQLNRKKYWPLLYFTTFLKVNVVQRFFSANVMGERKAFIRSASASAQPSLFFKTKFQRADFGDADKAATDFVKIISGKPWLDSVQIIVFSISGPAYDNPDFIRALSDIKDRESYPSFIRNMKLVEAFGYLHREDYFILDNHLNEQGHRKVANLLTAAIKSE